MNKSIYTESIRGKHFLPGSVISYDLYQKFQDVLSNTKFVAISILSNVMAWYRNDTNDFNGKHKPKLVGNSLPFSYDYLEPRFDISDQRLRRDLIRLGDEKVLIVAVVNPELASGARLNKSILYDSDETNRY